MSAMGLIVKSTGLESVTARLKDFQKKAVNLTVPLKQGGLLMLRSINKNFNSSGRPIPWKPLAYSTLKQKMKLGYSIKPLLRKGFLRASIATRATRDTLTVGTSITYAPYHQYGTKNIPQRKFLVFQKEDIHRMNKLVVQYLISKESSGG